MDSQERDKAVIPNVVSYVAFESVQARNNAKRDSMGRYSSERGYSRGYSGHNEELMQRINDLMNRTTEPQFKNELQHIARELEQM